MIMKKFLTIIGIIEIIMGILFILFGGVGYGAVLLLGGISTLSIAKKK